MFNVVKVVGLGKYFKLNCVCMKFYCNGNINYKVGCCWMICVFLFGMFVLFLFLIFYLLFDKKICFCF